MIIHRGCGSAPQSVARHSLDRLTFASMAASADAPNADASAPYSFTASQASCGTQERRRVALAVFAERAAMGPVPPNASS